MKATSLFRENNLFAACPVKQSNRFVKGYETVQFSYVYLDTLITLPMTDSSFYTNEATSIDREGGLDEY